MIHRHKEKSTFYTCHMFHFSFHTQAPIIVYQMIDENLQVAQTISGELVSKVLNDNFILNT